MKAVRVAVALLFVACVALPAFAAPTIEGGLPSWSILNVTQTGSTVNTSYYPRDTSLPITGQNIYRDVGTSNLNLYGGRITAGDGGIVSVQGAASGDSIVFYVPDMTLAANLIAGTWKGTVGQPYLDMNSHQIKTMADPTNLQDAMTLNYADTNYAAIGSIVTDHGALTGLADDDHIQYFLADGTRVMRGNIDVGAYNISNFSYADWLEKPVPPTPAADTLRLYIEDFKGFSFFSFKDDTGMVRKIVRDSVFVGKNVGANLAAYAAVYASGSSDGVPELSLAQADDAATMPAIGITIEPILTGDYGRVMQVGLLENVPTNFWVVGDVLYVSETIPGFYTTTPPAFPNIRQEMGTVLVSDPAIGAVQIVARSMFDNIAINTSYDTVGNNTDFAYLPGRPGGQILTGGTVYDDSLVLNSSMGGGGNVTVWLAGTTALSKFLVRDGDQFDVAYIDADGNTKVKSLILNGSFFYRTVNDDYLHFYGGTVSGSPGGRLILYGGDNIAQSGGLTMSVGNAAGDGSVVLFYATGRTDTPSLSLANNKITSLKDPTNAQDAVTKNYLLKEMGNGTLNDLYAYKLGMASGQQLAGGNAANEDLILNGTSHATKTTSDILLQPVGGRVGINTITPIDALEVAGGIHMSGGAAASKASEAYFDFSPITSQFRIDVKGDSSTRGSMAFDIMRGDGSFFLTPFEIKNTGNITLKAWTGIGAAPTHLLLLSTTGHDTVMRLHDADNGGGVGSIDYIQFGQTEGGVFSYNGVLGDAYLTSREMVMEAYNGGDVVLQYSGGNVSIGAEFDPEAQLDTTGDVKFRYYGAGDLYVDANGLLYTVSDEKYKTDIKSFTSGLSQILQVNPISYKFNAASGLDTVNDYTGFSAQNLQEVIPEAVSAKPDIKYEKVYSSEVTPDGIGNFTMVKVPVLDKDGKQTVTLSISDRVIIASLVNAIKEQQANITSQQLQIDNLIKRIEALEAKVK